MPNKKLSTKLTHISLFTYFSFPTPFWNHFAYLLPFCIIPKAAQDVVDKVKCKIEVVKSKISQNTTTQAFQNFRQLLLHPPGVFDVHSAMAAFEHLSDNAPKNGDQHARRYKAILKQTKGLFENQAIQRILLRLLGTKEEITIAKEMEKSTKSNPPSFLLFSSQVFNSQLPLARAHSYINCYACGLEHST